VAFVARSLSDENRLRILLCVSEAKKSVSGIVEELNLSQPLVSHHLKELRRALLVKVERRGPFVYYEIADARIVPILSALKDLATDLLAARTTFYSREEIDRMKAGIQELLARMAPEAALDEIGTALKQLLPAVSEENRLNFVVNLIGGAGDDKVASMVHL